MDEDYARRESRLTRQSWLWCSYVFHSVPFSIASGVFTESWWYVGGAALIMVLAYQLKVTRFSMLVIFTLISGYLGFHIGYYSIGDLGAGVVLAAVGIAVSSFFTYRACEIIVNGA